MAKGYDDFNADFNDIRQDVSELKERTASIEAVISSTKKTSDRHDTQIDEVRMHYSSQSALVTERFINVANLIEKLTRSVEILFGKVSDTEKDITTVKHDLGTLFSERNERKKESNKYKFWLATFLFSAAIGSAWHWVSKLLGFGG